MASPMEKGVHNLAKVTVYYTQNYYKIIDVNV